MAIVPLPVGPSCVAESWWIENSSRSGGVAPDGSEQFVVNPAGRWRAKLRFQCLTDADYREVDGFLGACDGPANPFLIGPYDWRGRPWNIDVFGVDVTPDRAAAADAADPIYSNSPLTRGDLDFRLAAAAAMNAVTVTMRRLRGDRIRRGQYFSIGQELHIISKNPADNGAVNVNFDATIRPWLRSDFANGTQMEFAAPVGLMRLTSGTAPVVERTPDPRAVLELDIVQFDGAP